MKKEIYIKGAVLLGSIIAIMSFVVIVMTYFVHLKTPFLTTVQKIMHLPAIIVDGYWIPISEIEENTKSIKRFYENQDFSQYGMRIDFSTQDGKKRLKLQERKMINKLMEDVAIQKLADEWDISVSDDAVQSAMMRPMEEMGTEDNVKNKLDKLYGWNLDDFAKNVVYKQILREKVQKHFVQENQVTPELKNRIEQAKKELDDNRMFEDVAKKYSDGATVADGGVMGWFVDSQLQDEIGKHIFTMNKGEYTDIIDTPIGLHIVKVNDVAQQDDKKVVHVSQIVVKKPTFADFLNERMKQMNTYVLLPEYVWNKNNAMIEFADEDMAEFENKTIEEAKVLKQQLMENTK